MQKVKERPVVGSKSLPETMRQIESTQEIKLNEGQLSAISEILSSRDRIIALQGGAGTGKTTVLRTINQAAEQSGYRMQGLAPTTRAAAQLAESGMPTKTLQRFLYEPRNGDNSIKCLYVLDESSLSSTKNIYKFFDRLNSHDRVLLVGDTRQHQAIEAGSPFEQLQLHGVQTEKLTEIVRQKNPELKTAVERLAAREVREAVARLDSQGRIIEVSDEKERLTRIAADYVAAPEKTLVISPANKERVGINTMIHKELQKQGIVDPHDHKMIVLVARQDLTGPERTFAGAYSPGEDIIRYNHRSDLFGVKAGDYGRVTATDHHPNLLTVQFNDGREITYDPRRLSGVTVYQEANRAFAAGDQIQFRAPLRDQKVSNGQLGQLDSLDGTKLSVILDNGKRITFDAHQFPHFDHGYAVTSYSSQGQTVDRVLINANSKESDIALNDRMAYVAVSRAREEATIYTDSKDDIAAALDRQVDKQTALESLNQSSIPAHFGVHPEHTPAGVNGMYGMDW